MQTICRAVIMGDRSGADGNHRFQLNGRLAELPADEIVEQFMEHLHDSQFLANRYAYELNAAIKVPDKDVILAVGTVVIREHKLPFTIMISEDDA